MVGNGWTIRESEDYLRGVALCGGARVVDGVIAPIMYALHRNPLAFPETTVESVRIARTKLKFNGPDVVLAHSVWFRTIETSRVVDLLWVEVTNPDDLGLEDDLPF